MGVFLHLLRDLMTSRVLPVGEWHKLAGTLVDPATLPNDAVPVVVEHDGQIVGCSVLIPVWHQEGTWIHPEYRGRISAGRQLFDAMRHALGRLGIDGVWMMATDRENEALIQKFGQAQRLDAAHFVVRV